MGGGGGAKGWVEVKKEKQMHFLHLQLAENLFILVHKGVQELNVPLCTIGARVFMINLSLVLHFIQMNKNAQIRMVLVE